MIIWLRDNRSSISESEERNQAGLIDLPITLITLPSAPIALRVRIIGHLDRTALGVHKAGNSSKKSQKNPGVNENNSCSSHSKQELCLLG